MAARDQNSYEGCFSSYRINLHLIQTKLTITSEHRHTKRIYRIEVDDKYVHSMTQGLCETCEHLFDILQELIDNNNKDKNKDLKIVEQKPKLILYAVFTMLFGRTSRQFKMKFELESVQLDDITRLENIINEQSQRLEQLEWNMNDRFNNATRLISFYKNFGFRSLSSADKINFSDNAHKVSLKTQEIYHERFSDSDEEQRDYNNSYMTKQVTKNDAIIITDQPFAISSNKRYQLIRFNVYLSCLLNNIKLLMGVVYEPTNKSWSGIAPSSDTWLLDISNGSIQHSHFQDQPYTWPLIKSPFYNSSFRTNQVQKQRYHNTATSNQINLTISVDILIDTYKRCLAFRVQGQTEDRWAFYLPEQIQINQLYPLVIFNDKNVSVSIDFLTH